MGNPAIPPLDPAALQQALALGGGGGQPPPPNVPAPNLGTMPEGMPQQAPQVGQQQNAPSVPGRDVSKLPALAGFLTQMVKGPGGYQAGENGQPGRPVSRLDAFESFVGNFLNSFSQGMSQAGQGPAANARGFGAGVQANYQRQIQQQQLQEQQQLMQAQAQEAAGRGAESQARATQMGQMVMLPNGVMVPSKDYAEKILPAQIGAQGKVAAAGVNRYAASPFGIYDKQTGKYSTADQGGGTIGATVKMTQEMANSGEFGPGAAQLVGKQVKISDLNGMQKATQGGYGFVQGAQGPEREKKVGPIGNLGVGSPAANAVAQAKLQLQRASFERDTFGEWVSNDLANKYPSLVSISQDGQTLGWKSPVAPTASIKTQAQQAQDLQKTIGEIKQDIIAAQKAGLLGPIEGRWNEFMVGSVGGYGPQFAKLRSEMSFLASGALKAHFGARGGADMYQHFVNQFDSGKMGAPDLIAGIEGMQTFFRTYAGRLQTTGGGDNKPKPATGTTSKPGEINFTPVKPG